MPVHLDKAKPFGGWIPVPSGVWYGSYGFFRVAALVFLLWGVAGILMASWAVLIGMRAGMWVSILLTLGAWLAAATALGHEWLAVGVTALGRENEVYATRLDKFQKQIKDLDGVAKKLEAVEKSTGMSVKVMEDTLITMHRLTSTESVLDIVHSFVNSDKSGKNKGDRKLEGNEVKHFFSNNHEKLKLAISDSMLQQMEAAALEDGFQVFQMQWLVTAIIASADENPARNSAMLDLIMFSYELDDEEGENKFAKLMVSLQGVLKTLPDDNPYSLAKDPGADKIRVMLRSAQDATDNDEQIKKLKEVGQIVMATQTEAS
jgi:hypothetical protein